MAYADYLKSADWKNKRKSKRTKKNRCAICGEKKKLHVHHLNYRNLVDVKQSDLRVLCKWCHYMVHALEKQNKIQYNSCSHHSKFGSLKAAVLKHYGVFGQNMFILSDDERDRALKHSKDRYDWVSGPLDNCDLRHLTSIKDEIQGGNMVILYSRGL